MERKSLVELKKIINQDIDYQNDFIKKMEGDKNPQIKEMYNRSLVRKEALEDVLRYISGGSKSHFYKLDE